MSDRDLPTPPAHRGRGWAVQPVYGLLSCASHGLFSTYYGGWGCCPVGATGGTPRGTIHEGDGQGPRTPRGCLTVARDRYARGVNFCNNGRPGQGARVFCRRLDPKFARASVLLYWPCDLCLRQDPNLCPESSCTAGPARVEEGLPHFGLPSSTARID